MKVKFRQIYNQIQYIVFIQTKLFSKVFAPIKIRTKPYD